MSPISLNARACAALVLLALFPVFVLAIVIGIMAFAIWVASQTTGSAGAHIFLLAIPLVWAVAAATRDVFRARKQAPLPGHELGQADHPQLWAELSAISRAMRQPLPDRVVVAPIVNAMVTTGTGKREVLIGYPLLVGMNRLQLRAVLAHEMGHLAHGHTRTGALAYRAGEILEQTVARMDQGIVRRLVSGYHHLYLLISMSVMRDHERQADEWSARLAGGPEAATMFDELSKIAGTWELLCDSYLPLAAEVKARPGLAKAMQELRQANQRELDEFAARQLALTPSRWSTHPPDAERKRFLEQAPAVEPGPSDLYPAWQLLGRKALSVRRDTPDWEAAGAALLEIEQALLPDEAQPATWEAVVQEFQLKSAQSHTALVLDQLTLQSPDSHPTLRGLLMAMSEGSGSALVAPLLRGDLPAAERAQIQEKVLEETAQTATQLAVMNAGRARWAVRWDGPAELEYLDGNGAAQEWPDDFTIVSPIDPYSVNPLLTHLYTAGISIDTPLVSDLEAQAEQRSLRSITVGAVSNVSPKPRPPGTNRHTIHDLLVMDDGLLIERSPALSLRARMVFNFHLQYMPGPLRRASHARVQDLARRVDGDPKGFAADPANHATWLPYADVAGGALKYGMDKSVRLSWPDGSTTAIRWTNASVEIGDVERILNQAFAP